MKTRSVLILSLAGSMLGVLGAAAAAQDDGPVTESVAYATGIAGGPAETVDATQLPSREGRIRFDGLQLIDIPVRFSDPRLTGLLTISSNGSGQTFSDGFARIDPRTYRIDAMGGSWTGSGERVIAVSLGRPRPLINHESMVLFGDGAYAGLVAYVFIELANAAPELEAIVLDTELTPLPDPVAARNRRDVDGPARPATDIIAQGVTPVR